MRNCILAVCRLYFLLVLVGGSAFSQSDGSIVRLGESSGGAPYPPTPNSGFVDIAASYSHGIALRADGSVALWGETANGQSTPPVPNSGFVAVAAGEFTSLGLKDSGMIVGWGLSYYGQGSFGAETGFVAVVGGFLHTLGLKANGSIVARGDNRQGECNVPQPNSGFIDIAAGYGHSLGLRADGTVTAWGLDNYGQCAVPYPNADFIKIAAGQYHSLGLKSDGSIVAWGWNRNGQCNVPSPNQGFIDIAGGDTHSVGLTQSGTIVAWGACTYVGCTFPAPNTGFTAIAAGNRSTYGLRAGGAELLSVNASVVSVGTGLAVAGAKVTLLESGQAVASGNTNAQGKITLLRIWRGSDRYYALRVSYRGCDTDQAMGFFAPGARENATVAVPTYIELTGNVKDSFNRRGIVGAQIQVWSANSTQAPIGSTVTDDNGNFRYDVQTSGAYYFEAIKRGMIGTAGMDTLYSPRSSAAVAVDASHVSWNLGSLRLPSRVVVLVHGWNSNAGIWRNNGYPEELRRSGWSVVDNVNLPGIFGGTRGWATITEQADSLKKYIDPLGVRSVNIVAHSAGGLVSRYLNENLGPRNYPMVYKLICLATPHHGSPLASIPVGLYEIFKSTLIAADPTYGHRAAAEVIRSLRSAMPVIGNLAPNSDFLKELNQRQTGFFVNDWTGNCTWDNPNPELGLVLTTKYLTMRGTSWGNGAFVISGGLMAMTYGCECLGSDGVVPTESAMLHSTASNVYNYEAAAVVHHKVRDYGIVESTAVRDEVLLRLSQDPSTWPPESKALHADDELGASTWSLVGAHEAYVGSTSGGADTLRIDLCDTLKVAWSWRAGDVALSLVSPSGAIVDSTYAALDPSVEMSVDRAAMVGWYTLALPDSGQWICNLQSAQTTEDQYVGLFVTAAGGVTMAPSLEVTTDASFADRIVRAMLRGSTGQPALGAAVSAAWTGPSGASGQLQLLDDGVSPDAVANDGQYAALLAVAQQYGTTDVVITAEGMSPAVFHRNASLSFSEELVLDVGVGAPGLELESRNALALSPVTLRGTIQNRGALAANVLVRFELGDSTQVQESQIVVPAGGVADIEAFHLPMDSGTHTYRMTVIPSGDYADLDLADNVATATIAISPAVSGVHDEAIDNGPDDAALSALGSRNVAIRAAYPNPFNPSITLELVQRAAGKVDVRIFDIRGRLVRDLYSGAQPAGGFKLGWDGLDDAGRRASSGAYFAHMRSPSGEDTKKILLVK